MGGQPCRLKALMNAQTISAEAEFLAEEFRSLIDDLPTDEGYKIVERLNIAEDAVFEAKKLFLESQGFKGPWPQSLRRAGE